MKHYLSSRRDFMRTAVAAGGFALSAPLNWAAHTQASDAGPAIAGEDGMIIRSERFLDLEMPPEFADSWITPISRFYVRNHMFEPDAVKADQWQLTIGGEVERPVTLKLPDLAAFDQHSVTNTLECAGNGRAFQNPKVPGIQWAHGAVGNALFRGPRLADLLNRAGVKSSGKHVMFRGLDQVPGNVPPFIRSIPIEKATDSETLIATYMNGVLLPRHHGAPARALVPGWVGAASCKWLTEIKVIEKEFEGNFMKPGYRYPNQPVAPGTAVNPDDTHALTALTVKSMIAGPGDGARVKHGPVRIHGAAWAGEADIVKVEISTDGGENWNGATLGKDNAHYAWRLWSYTWRPSAGGDYQVLSRATDSRGRVQPAKAEWNPSGYLYNAYDRVTVHVQA